MVEVYIILKEQKHDLNQIYLYLKISLAEQQKLEVIS